MGRLTLAGIVLAAGFAGGVALMWWISPPSYARLGLNAAQSLVKQRGEDAVHKAAVRQFEAARLESEAAKKKAEFEAQESSNRLEEERSSLARARTRLVKRERQMMKDIQVKEAALQDHSATLRESVVEECPDLVPLYDKNVEEAQAVIKSLKAALAEEQALRFQTEHTLDTSLETLDKTRLVVRHQAEEIQILAAEVTEYKDYVEKLKGRRFRFTPLAITVGGHKGFNQPWSAGVAVGLGIAF